MNRDWLNIINSYLARGIDRGYKRGFDNAFKKNLKFVEPPKLKVRMDYNSIDLEAIKNFKLEAFTVAGIGSWELEEKLKTVAEKFMRKEIDKEDFEFETRKLMIQYGIGLSNQPPTGWLEANLDNAVVSSVQAARWNRLSDPVVSKVYPYLEYRTQRDGRVRDEHRSLDGRTLPKDDPAWRTIYPPNGWNCRCYTVPLTKEEADEKEITKSTSEQRKEWNADIDPDFRRNPGMSGSIWGKWLNTKLTEMPAAELSNLKSLIREYGKNL